MSAEPRSEATSTVDGGAGAQRSWSDVVNPATGAVFARVAECSADDLDRAMRAAKRAQPAWAADAHGRREALSSYADALAVHEAELIATLVAEQGKPRHEATGEVRGGIGALREHASLALPTTVVQDDPVLHSEVIRRPHGVVAAIVPWNFPLSIALVKIGAALSGGNTVVLKPAPGTPVTTLVAGEIGRGVLPAGVLNIVAGADDLGAAMVRHPAPRSISFTGSVATGKAIARAAADDLKRITLELGGNDAAIVLADCDPAEVGPRIAAIAFRNCGQICATIKRVYVHESRHDEVLAAITESVAALAVGDGSHDGIEVGPIQNRSQRARIEELVDEARAGGATVTTGGHRGDGPGFTYRPAVLAGVADGQRIVDEEQFGPALPLMSFRTDDEAVRRANDTTYGLGASVWGRDPERLRAVALRLEAGVVSVNTHDIQVPGAPFGGRKWSGIGVEGGLHGILGLTDPQVMNTLRGGP